MKEVVSQSRVCSHLIFFFQFGPQLGNSTYDIAYITRMKQEERNRRQQKQVSTNATTGDDLPSPPQFLYCHCPLLTRLSVGHTFIALISCSIIFVLFYEPRV